MITQIAVVTFLVILNGILAMAELSIVSARKAILEQRKNDGDKRALIALELAQNPGSLLATIQVALTLLSTMTGALGGATLADNIAPFITHIPYIGHYSYQISLAVIIILLTYFTLIVGELVPKQLALSYAEDIAIAIATPLKFFSKLIGPPVRFLDYSTKRFLAVLGIKTGIQSKVTEQEIRDLIDQGARAGILQEVEQDMLERVFRLSDRKIQLLMTPRSDVIWLDIQDDLNENIKKISESPHSFFPVCEGSIDKVIGVVSLRSIWQANLEKNQPDLRSLVSEVIFVPDYMSALRVLNRFKESGKTIAVVLDEYGSFEGLVSINDFIQAIVGELSAPGELEPEIVKRADGSWLIDGRLAIDELKDLLEISELPGEENYQTLAGFIMSFTGKIPRIGDQFEWSNFRFEIVDMDRHRIDRVWISKR